MSMLTRAAYQTATAPASVGVNTPEKMPPRMTRGASRAQTLSTKVRFSSAR